MVEKPDPITQDPHDTDEALKKRLISRVAIAGVIVVALLGGLAVIDALYVPPPRKAAPTETEAAKTPETEPQAAAGKAEEKAAAEPEQKPTETAQAAKPEAPPEPPAPAAEPERTAAVAAPPPKPMRPLTAPASARTASIRPSEPIAAPRKPEAAAEIARALPAPSTLAHHAPASRPLTRTDEATRQFVVQMGVFNNLANAEDLRAKLEQAGVPAQIEARVQVGPFKTRQEAETAREKLRAMGMETGILAAIRR